VCVYGLTTEKAPEIELIINRSWEEVAGRNAAQTRH